MYACMCNPHRCMYTAYPIGMPYTYACTHVAFSGMCTHAHMCEHVFFRKHMLYIVDIRVGTHIHTCTDVGFPHKHSVYLHADTQHICTLHTHTHATLFVCGHTWCSLQAT